MHTRKYRKAWYALKSWRRWPAVASVVLTVLVMAGWIWIVTEWVSG